MTRSFGLPQFAAFLVLVAIVWAGFGIGDHALRIGVIAPLTGPASIYGISMRNGIRLAADAVNAGGGIAGQRLELVFADDANDKITAAEAARNLIYRDNVKLVIGTVSSDATMNVQRVCEKARIPMLTSVSTNPFITRVGSRYSFRCLTDDTVQASELASFAVRTLQLRRVAILHDSNKYGSMGARVYAARATELGQSIIANVAFDGDTVNFTKHLESIRPLNPDGLLIWGLAQESGLIVRQARELGMGMPVLGGDGMAPAGFLDLAGPAAEGAVVTMPFNPAKGGQAAQAFMERYRGAFGSDPDSFAAHSFDALHLAASALRSSAERGIPLREALAAITAYDGVTGKGGFDASGNETRPVELARVQGGRFVPAVGQ